MPENLKAVGREDWVEDCYFHGHKKKAVFQHLLNYLHSKQGFPTNLNVAFSMAVCVCKETFGMMVYSLYFANNAVACLPVTLMSNYCCLSLEFKTLLTMPLTDILYNISFKVNNCQ